MEQHNKKTPQVKEKALLYTLEDSIGEDQKPGTGFMIRDIVRFFIVDLIVSASLQLLLRLDFFTTIDHYVVAILISKVIVFFYVIWLVRDRRDAWPETGGATAGNWWAWPLSLALYAAAYPLIIHADRANRHLMTLLYDWLGKVYQHQPQSVIILTFEDILALPVRLTLIFFIVIAGPFLEELTFRGMAMDACRRSRGMLWAGFWTSLLFSMYHFNLSLLLPLSILGAVFAAARLLSRSLWCAVMVHCLHNALTLVILARELGLVDEWFGRFFG